MTTNSTSTAAIPCLAGNLRATDAAKPSNVCITDVPSAYDIINVGYAVVDRDGLVSFPFYKYNISIPKLRELKEQCNIKVLLTVGGPEGNFNYLNNSGAVNTFYNSLFNHIVSTWGFDGVTFDIRQLDDTNRADVIAAIERFYRFSHENGVKSLISLTATSTFVCPAVDRVTGPWNQLVEVINELKDILSFIQIRAYDYGNSYQTLKHHCFNNTAEIMRYIFESYANPFHVGYLKYEGFDVNKLLLGVLASEQAGSGFIAASEVKNLVQQLTQEYQTSIGGVMVESINYDAQNCYAFVEQLNDEICLPKP